LNKQGLDEDLMTLAFLLIGGCIVGLILLGYYTNAISGSNFSPAHLRELRKADEDEKQSNEGTSSFQEQSNKSEGKHLRVLKPELQAEYEKQKQIEHEEKIKVEYEEKIKAQKEAQDVAIKRQLAKEAQDAKLQYEKLNYIGGWEKHDSLPLDKALEIGVPYQKCFVYKLSVGGSDYIGFTTQKPKKRLEQHLNSAKEGSGQKVHVALRRFGYLHEFEVISEHENEILGLVDEIINIKKHSAELNTSIGGEGNFFLVAEKGSHQGEQIFFVEKQLPVDQFKPIDKVPPNEEDDIPF